MRILHVLPFFSPQMGGSAQAAYQVCKGLGALGHEVTVVTSDYAAKEAPFEKGPFKVIYFPGPAVRGFYLTPALVLWVRKHVADYDVVHMHTVRTFQNAVVGYYASKKGVPYVLSAHGTLPVFMDSQGAKKLYDRIAGRRLLANADHLIAVSQFEAEQFYKFGIERDRVKVIYNGLDLDEYESLPKEGLFRRRLVLQEKHPLILFLGRIHAIKNIDLVINAFSRMNHHGMQPSLIIAGPDDGHLQELKGLARRLDLVERIHFTGPIYGQDKLSALVDADLLVSTAQYEIFGLVPFEALMCGTPVVIADRGGAAELISDAEAGEIIPFGDGEALVNTMEHVLSHPEASIEKVQSGQSFVRKRLDWRVLAAETASFYEERILSSRRNQVSGSAHVG